MSEVPLYMRNTSTNPRGRPKPGAVCVLNREYPMYDPTNTTSLDLSLPPPLNPTPSAENGPTSERWGEAASDVEIHKVDNARTALLLVNSDTRDGIAPLSPFGVSLSWEGHQAHAGVAGKHAGAVGQDASSALTDGHAAASAPGFGARDGGPTLLSALE